VLCDVGRKRLHGDGCQCGRSLSYLEHRQVNGGVVSSTVTEGGGEAKAGDNVAGRKILDWGEDGKAIYDDGTVGDGEDVEAGQRDLAQVCGALCGSLWLATVTV
jgi:hypothetical protein